ncbi:TolC family protein [Halovulum sp. GXIMD14794]
MNFVCKPRFGLRAMTLMACLLGAGGQALAQMSLQDAVLLATERDPGITAIRQQVAGRSIQIQAEKDAYYPSINISGDSGTTDANGPGITLTVSQVLYDWGMIRSRVASATQERVKTVSELKMAVEDLTLQVAGYFLDIEVLDRKIARTETYMAFAERIAGQAEDRARGGVGDTGEVARARLEVARIDDQMSQLQSNREIAAAQLEFLLQQMPGATAAPPELGFSAHYGSAAKIRSAVLIAPDYVAARAEADQAEAGIQTAKAQRLPAFQLQAEARTDLNGGRTDTAIGIAAGVDISSSGLGRRQIQAAQMEWNAAKSSLSAVERELTNSAVSALDRLQTLRATEASRAAQLIESQKVLDTYEKQFIGGQRELIDLLTTGRDLYDAQIDELDTYDERKRTEYEAARDLGVLGTLILAALGAGG